MLSWYGQGLNLYGVISTATCYRLDSLCFSPCGNEIFTSLHLSIHSGDWSASFTMGKTPSQGRSGSVMPLPTDPHLAPRLIGRAVTLLCHCTFTACYRILLITSMRFKLCMQDGSQIIAWTLATNKASVWNTMSFSTNQNCHFVTPSSNDNLWPHKNCNMSMFSDDLLSIESTKTVIIINRLPDVSSLSPIKGLQDSE